MKYQKPSHVYIGRDKGGCCLAVRNDDGDKDTGLSVAEMIATGLIIERIEWDTYVKEVSHEESFLNCQCEPVQPELFEESCANFFITSRKGI